jgi:addiction module HigA family antidote
MVMMNPPHPGEIVRELCLKPLNLGVGEGAKALGISRQVFSGFLSGRYGMSPKMAFRLEIVFGGTAQSWLTSQMHYDLWCAKKEIKSLKLKRFAA